MDGPFGFTVREAQSGKVRRRPHYETYGQKHVCRSTTCGRRRHPDKDWKQGRAAVRVRAVDNALTQRAQARVADFSGHRLAEAEDQCLFVCFDRRGS
uniref:Uncharacterized protein n=1 Tax=Peronospora matthiolae TaxID=2874970 RepID=A0AAV1TM07_9STRA